MSKFIPNSFQIPNALVDEMMAKMSGAELKCYLAIVRKTKGWGKDEDAISVAQLMELTGLSNRQVINSCRALVECGLLTQKTGKRGIKILSINQCTKFTSEESSHVKKVHTTCEKSSLVTSEKTSHTKNNIKYTPKNTNINIPREKDLMISFALENQVDESLAEEFIQYRKSVVKKPLTLRAIKGLAREAKKAGMSLTEVLELVMEKTWRGFEARFIDKPSEKLVTQTKTHAAVIDLYNKINSEFGDVLAPALESNPSRNKAIDELLANLKYPTLDCVESYFTLFFENLTDWHRSKNIGIDYVLRLETLTKVREGAL